MNAVILNIFGKLSHDQTPAEIAAQRRQIVREDVKNALFGFHPERIAQAQARAERNLRNGVPLGVCIDRAVAWARCATDPNPPQAA